MWRFRRVSLGNTDHNIYAHHLTPDSEIMSSNGTLLPQFFGAVSKYKVKERAKELQNKKRFFKEGCRKISDARRLRHAISKKRAG